ncbi:hypothetical protein NHX12_009015 [Muraenolepis orangiensis]|uniref:Uncharacterized protein n=1 Tax=Muraenolepis orangiensis TaxID=630683 RepID=A0A9Q0DMG9_9TELE|nr:hypothetical protein NHX12_009015 [Muraenolepis orangiensis]
MSSLRCTICVLFLSAVGVRSTTLRLPREEERHVLPQNSGFLTINADVDLPHGTQGAAAPRLRRTARSGAEDGLDGGGGRDGGDGGDGRDGGSDHRLLRRAAAGSAMPKVYGQGQVEMGLMEEDTD